MMYALYKVEVKKLQGFTAEKEKVFMQTNIINANRKRTAASGATEHKEKKRASIMHSLRGFKYSTSHDSNDPSSLSHQINHHNHNSHSDNNSEGSSVNNSVNLRHGYNNLNSTNHSNDSSNHNNSRASLRKIAPISPAKESNSDGKDDIENDQNNGSGLLLGIAEADEAANLPPTAA